MLSLYIHTNDIWDEKKEIFLPGIDKTIHLEHSLISISKWESKWHKPFMSTNLTPIERMSYIECMILDDIDTSILNYLSTDNVNDIMEYINDPMSARKNKNVDKKSGRSNTGEIVTSELIYCWMIELNIPSDYASWHLNRLISLIDVCTSKKTPPKKMSTREIMQRNAALNAARCKKYKTRG